MKMLDEFYVHTFFLGVSGIDLQNGVTVANIYEAEIKKRW